jgi:hypothetical protein
MLTDLARLPAGAGHHDRLLPLLSTVSCRLVTPLSATLTKNRGRGATC